MTQHTSQISKITELPFGITPIDKYISSTRLRVKGFWDFVGSENLRRKEKNVRFAMQVLFSFKKKNQKTLWFCLVL